MTKATFALEYCLERVSCMAYTARLAKHTRTFSYPSNAILCILLTDRMLLRIDENHSRCRPIQGTFPRYSSSRGACSNATIMLVARIARSAMLKRLNESKNSLCPVLNGRSRPTERNAESNTEEEAILDTRVALQSTLKTRPGLGDSPRHQVSTRSRGRARF